MIVNIGDYWQYAVVLPALYIVKMVISNNKTIQEMKEYIAKECITDSELDRHEKRMMDYIHTFQERIETIDKKIDHVLMHVKKP